MQTVIPVSFDFSQGQITVNWKGDKLVLCEKTLSPTLKIESANILGTKLQGDQVFFLV